MGPARWRARLWLALVPLPLFGCTGPATQVTDVVHTCTGPRVRVSPTQGSMEAGETIDVTAEHLPATVSPSNIAGCSVPVSTQDADLVTWTSSNPNVAVVSSVPPAPRHAQIIGAGDGSATITATLTGVGSAQMTVTVTPLGLVVVSPTAFTLDIGQSASIHATATSQGGSEVFPPIHWTSSNNGIVSVTAGTGGNATLQALSAGDVTITAAVGTVTAQATVHVRGLVLQSFVTGTMYAADGTTPLPGMRLQLSRDGVGIRTITTDANGHFLEDITPGGNMGLFAQGICDAVHTCMVPLRSYHSTENETFTVAAGETKVFDPSAQRGYHLEVVAGTGDRTVVPGFVLGVQVSYKVWNRAGLPGAVTWIAVGVEGTPGGAHLVGIAGSYTAQNAAATGVGTVNVTAPSTPGTYNVYAFLVATSTGQQAMDFYTQRFNNGVQFVKLLTLTVTP